MLWLLSSPPGSRAWPGAPTLHEKHVMTRRTETTCSCSDILCHFFRTALSTPTSGTEMGTTPPFLVKSKGDKKTSEGVWCMPEGSQPGRWENVLQPGRQESRKASPKRQHQS